MFKTIKKFLPILLSLLFVIACGGYDGPQSTFDTHGPVAKEQADLFYLILWAGMVVLVAVELAIVYIYILNIEERKTLKRFLLRFMGILDWKLFGQFCQLYF